jgi:hypothetical protein
VAPEVVDFQQQVVGTGGVGVAIAAPGAIQQASTYTLSFTNPAVWQNDPTVAYTLANETTGAVVEEGVVSGGQREIPPLEGFIVDIRNETAVAVIDSTVRFTGEGGTYLPVVRPASISAAVSSRFVPLPADFEVHFTEAVADTSLRLAFGMREIPTPFYLQNVMTRARQDFVVLEDVPELQNGEYDHGELIVIVSGEAPGVPPQLEGGRWRSNWAIRLLPPDPALEPDTPVVPPAPGAVLHFRTSKPFQTGDRVTFSVQPPAFEQERAAAALGDIVVVPNPYVATSVFEPPNTYRTGRGERRIYFMNLPPECTIRIYTLTGQLVQTLQHQATIDDGQLAWDLVSRDGMNVAYGVYVYHVEAPGLGEHIGRFALIK